MALSIDYLKLHFIILIWGFTAILGLLITIPPIEVVLYRTLFASIGLALIIYLKRGSFRVSQVGLLKLLGTGLIIAGHWILFFAAARVSTASLCLAGMATTALWTSILEPIAFNKKIQPFEIVLALITIAGLYVVFRFELNNSIGLLMAVTSAFLAAIFTIINAKLVRQYNHYTITFYEMVGACLGTLLFLPIYSSFFSDGEGLQLALTFSDFAWLVVLSLICTVYAFTVSVELMNRISAFAMNLTVNMEPVYGIILAFIVFGDKEKMSAGFYWGTLIIMLSVLSYPLINRWKSRKPLETDILR